MLENTTVLSLRARGQPNSTHYDRWIWGFFPCVTGVNLSRWAAENFKEKFFPCVTGVNLSKEIRIVENAEVLSLRDRGQPLVQTSERTGLQVLSLRDRGQPQFAALLG